MFGVFVENLSGGMQRRTALESVRDADSRLVEIAERQTDEAQPHVLLADFRLHRESDRLVLGGREYFDRLAPIDCERERLKTARRSHDLDQRSYVDAGRASLGKRHES